MSRVVGLDVSLRAPGVCWLHGKLRRDNRDRCGRICSRIGDGLEAEATSFRLGEDLRGPHRLAVLTDAIEAWLRSRDLLTVGRLYVQEGYAFGSQQSHSLGEIGGCIRKVIWQSGGNLIVIPPSTLKRFVTGVGKGNKNVMVKHVDKRWGFDSDDENECDAFACSMVGLVDTYRDEWSAIEADILSKKVERYAGKDQEAWLGGGAPGKMARRSRRRLA